MLIATNKTLSVSNSEPKYTENDMTDHSALKLKQLCGVPQYFYIKKKKIASRPLQQNKIKFTFPHFIASEQTE